MPYNKKETLIQFETFEPIVVRFQQKLEITDSQNKNEPIEDDGKGLIFVTHPKKEKSNSTKKKSFLQPY